MIELNSVSPSWLKAYSLPDEDLGVLFYKHGTLSVWCDDWDDDIKTVHIVDENYSYVRKNLNRVVGELEISRCTVGGRIVWQVDIAGLDKRYHGQGVFPALYRMLSRAGYPIRMGKSISVGAIALWSKLADAGLVLGYERGRWYTVDSGAVDEGNAEALVCFG